MKMLTGTLQVKLFTIMYRRIFEFLRGINFNRCINLLGGVKIALHTMEFIFLTMFCWFGHL